MAAKRAAKQHNKPLHYSSKGSFDNEHVIDGAGLGDEDRIIEQENGFDEAGGQRE